MASRSNAFTFENQCWTRFLNTREKERQINSLAFAISTPIPDEVRELVCTRITNILSELQISRESALVAGQQFHDFQIERVEGYLERIQN